LVGLAASWVNCSGLTSIIIPGLVTSIGNSAFSGCSKLTSITIPDSVTSIKSQTFYNCTGLTPITIMGKITSIGNSAFLQCEGLTSISIPGSVTSIDYGAFFGCSSLTSISISASVTSIGDFAFENCSSLTSISISDSVTSIGRDAFFCTAWYYSQPFDLVYLNNWVLGYKGSIPASVTIKTGITRIADYAFFGCSSLTSISIPGSVTLIGKYAFSSCTGLTSIYAYPTTPVDISDGIQVFDRVNKATCTLYVPTGSKAAYQAATEWKAFSDIVEMTTAVPTINDANFSLYLNPVDNVICVNGRIGILWLFDINGRVLLTKQFTGNESVSIASLPKGWYIVKLITAEGMVERKMLKR